MRQDDTPKIAYGRLSRPALSEVLILLDAIKRARAEIFRAERRIREISAHDERTRNRPPARRVAALCRLHFRKLGSWPRAHRTVAELTGYPLELVQLASQTEIQQIRKAVSARRRAEILRLYRQGLKYREIAEQAGCTTGWVSRVVAEDIGPSPRRRRNSRGSTGAKKTASDEP